MGTNRRFFNRRLSIRSGIFLILILSCFLGITQERKVPSKSEMEAEINARKAQMEFYMRHMKRDPKGARDSVKVIIVKRNHAKALELIKWYRSNDRLDTLLKIDISYAQLSEIPDFVYRAKNIQTLVLDYNVIRKLPKQLRELDSLKKIYWRDNQLSETRVKISKLTQVKKLSLENNDLMKFPKTKRLKGLEIIELNGNAFEKIPINKIRKNKRLKELAMGENPLKIGKAKYQKLAFLKSFKANKCGLTSIHSSFYLMSGLDEIQLQENKLSHLPDGISNLKSLTKFSCYQNQLEDLPIDFFQLSRLKVADIYYNKLEVIPPKIENLDSLEILYLSYNKIYSLPEELGNLTTLKELYLHHNRLSVLPESLKNLDSLRVVRVNDNYLLEFPSQLLGLKALEEVDVDNNELSTLPEAVEQLDKLTLFTFLNNSIDLDTEENVHIPPMIERMVKRGVFCKPVIYQESWE